MSTNSFCYNNKFYQADQPAFGLNRAIKYGDGLFESMRVINGEIPFLPFHLERLKKGMNFLKIEVKQQQFEEIRICIEQLLIKNEVDHGGKVRLVIFRSGNGKYSPDTNQSSYIIEAEPLSNNSFLLNKKGMSIDLAKSTSLYPNPCSRFKTLNALPYVLASIERDQRFIDELIMVNQEGNIVEATSSNIFLVQNNKLFTPSLKEGCLDGVMRRVLIQLARKKDISVEETAIREQDLEKADEIFLSNAIQGIQWVGSYQRKRYFNKMSQKLHQLLLP